MVDEHTHFRHQQAMLEILKEFDRVCKALNIPYVLFAGTLLGAVRHEGFIPWDDDLDVLLLRDDYERFLKSAPERINTERFYLQKEFGDHWPMFFSKLRMNGTTCIERFHPKDHAMHQGIYIDIFPCDDAAGTGLGRVFQFASSKVVIAKSLYERGYDTNDWRKKLFITLCRPLPMAPFLRIVKKGKVNGKYVHSFLGGASSYVKNIYPRNMFAKTVCLRFEDEYYPVPQEYDTLLRQLFGDYRKAPSEQIRRQKIHAIFVDVENTYENYRDYLDDVMFEEYSHSIR